MNKIVNRSSNYLAPVTRRINAFWMLAVALILGAVGQSQAAFVSADTNGAVTFDPSGLLTPIVTGIVAAIIAGIVLFVLFKGTRWVLRAVGLMGK